MSRSRRRKTSGVRIELAPFVDVLMVLLVFFVMVTSITLYQHGIALRLPSAKSGSQTKRGIIVTVDASQRVFLDHSPIAPEDLESKVVGLMQESPNLQVVLHADKSVPYEAIIRVLDDVRLGGCFDIVLEAQKKVAP